MAAVRAAVSMAATLNLLSRSTSQLAYQPTAPGGGGGSAGGGRGRWWPVAKSRAEKVTMAQGTVKWLNGDKG
jgi:hypothetical protein